MMHPEVIQNNYNISVSAVHCKSKFPAFNKHDEDLKKSVPKSSCVLWQHMDPPYPYPQTRHRNRLQCNMAVSG